MLVRAGANVKAANRYGATPLWLASVNGNARTMAMLLEAGADASAANAEGETALMVAARTGKPDAVSALLARGADPNAKEGWRGQTALMWAAAEGHAAVIDTLVARGADLNARSNAGFTALLFAAREGRIAAVETLLKAGADINDSLPVRRRAGQPQESSQPAAPPKWASMRSCLPPPTRTTSWRRGCSIAASIRMRRRRATPRFIRCPGCARPALPAATTRRRRAPAAWTASTFVRTLVAKGARLDARVTKRPSMGVTTLNSIGATPFLLAARTADAPLMKLLAELGADPRLANEDGSTPLMVAAGLGTNAPGEDPGTEPEVLEAVKVALELGNDLNAVDKNGETAMHGAAYKHVPSVVRYLAEKGARHGRLESSEQQGLDAAQDHRRHPARHEHRQLAGDRRGDPPGDAK